MKNVMSHEGTAIFVWRIETANAIFIIPEGNDMNIRH